METHSNSNSNSITNTSSDSEERKQQARDELANEIFGSLTSESDNNALSSSSSSPIIMMKKQTTTKEPSKNMEIPDVKEALNEYFKLKQKYENQIMVNKKKIINNPSLSKREKRSEYIKLKPKCINCNRPGGTRFVIHYVEEKSSQDKYEEPYRQYSATCGVIAEPCNLNVKIQIGITELLPDILNKYQNDIKDLKNKVIDDKNKLLFGYITTEQALENFEKVKDDINRLSEFYEFYLEEYNNVVDNDNKKQELNEAITQSYIEINNIKDYIKRMNETDNIQFAKDAVNIYNGTLKPLLDKIRHLKYNEYSILHNEENNTCNLIQNKYTTENLLFTFFQNKVISYTFGKEPMSKQKPGLIVANNLSSTTSSSEPILKLTDKQQIQPASAHKFNIPFQEPTIVDGNLVWTEEYFGYKNPLIYKQTWDKLSDDMKNVLKNHPDLLKRYMVTCVNAKANNEECKIDIVAIPQDEPIYGQGKDGVSWSSPEYNSLWNNLPIKFKNVLKSDKDWMKLFMFNCVNSIANKKLCSFTSPPDLKVPPNQIELPNGQYDFGVPIYNEVFNKLDTISKRNYLSNGNMFKIMMNKEVSKVLDFNPNAL